MRRRILIFLYELGLKNSEKTKNANMRMRRRIFVDAYFLAKNAQKRPKNGQNRGFLRKKLQNGNKICVDAYTPIFHFKKKKYI